MARGRPLSVSRSLDLLAPGLPLDWNTGRPLSVSGSLDFLAPGLPLESMARYLTAFTACSRNSLGLEIQAAESEGAFAVPETKVLS